MQIPFDDSARLGYVWLVWGMTKERCDLIAIATTPEAEARYVAAGEHRGNYRLVKSEKAFVDHLYGGGMLAVINDANSIRAR